jgi:putative salt-induced outer membrane protein YdiY
MKVILFAGIAAFTMLLSLSPSVSNAAVITLKNGDRITGRIVRMQNHVLEIDPYFSGDNLKIDWDKVRSITESERPLSIKLMSTAELPENLGQRLRDRIILQSLEEGGPIRLEDVRSINLAEHDYRGYISLGGNQTTGNTETQAFNMSATLTYRKNEHRLTLDGKYNRAQAGQEDTANNGAISLKYDYFLTRRLFTGGFSLSETDQFQNLTLRETGGVFLGYALLDTDRQLLWMSAGPALVYQDFTTDAATISPSASWQLRYEVRFRGGDVTVFHKQWGFKDLGHGSATRVNADQGIQISIADRWKVHLEYDLRYNSLPVADRKTTDINMIIGLSYDLKP